jgi:hypothetical protein
MRALEFPDENYIARRKSLFGNSFKMLTMLFAVDKPRRLEREAGLTFTVDQKKTVLYSGILGLG